MIPTAEGQLWRRFRSLGYEGKTGYPQRVGGSALGLKGGVDIINRNIWPKGSGIRGWNGGEIWELGEAGHRARGG